MHICWIALYPFLEHSSPVIYFWQKLMFTKILEQSSEVITCTVPIFATNQSTWKTLLFKSSFRETASIWCVKYTCIFHFFSLFSDDGSDKKNQWYRYGKFSVPIQRWQTDKQGTTKSFETPFSPIGSNRRTSQEIVIAKLLDFFNCVEGKFHRSFLKPILIAVVDFHTWYKVGNQRQCTLYNLQVILFSYMYVHKCYGPKKHLLWFVMMVF